MIEEIALCSDAAFLTSDKINGVIWVAVVRSGKALNPINGGMEAAS